MCANCEINVCVSESSAAGSSCYLIELLAGANLWQTHIHIHIQVRAPQSGRVSLPY